MPREYEGYRETLSILCEKFGKDTITLNEFASYISVTRDFASKQILDGNLPGKKVAGKFVIPLTQLARWECMK